MNSSENVLQGRFASHWVVLARKPEHLLGVTGGVERWPGDPLNLWRDLVNKQSADHLTKEELAQWISHYVTRRQELLKLTAEEAKKLQDELDKKSTDEQRRKVQDEIDEQWREQELYRKKVGLWEDDFSNLLSVFSGWGHR